MLLFKWRERNDVLKLNPGVETSLPPAVGPPPHRKGLPAYFCPGVMNMVVYLPYSLLISPLGAAFWWSEVSMGGLLLPSLQFRTFLSCMRWCQTAVTFQATDPPKASSLCCLARRRPAKPRSWVSNILIYHSPSRETVCVKPISFIDKESACVCVAFERFLILLFFFFLFCPGEIEKKFRTLACQTFFYRIE